ncbi:DUF2188 domain-containing protein [Sorangium sp. So ce1151]|uniref:DUF2188 domain-containing protein n=1 Tax=Sorangium sp. So ce1151 TaxID=3133332 RepID=UPI003F60A13E
MPKGSRGGSKPPRVHIDVNPSPKGWRVEERGAKRADSVHERKSDAVERAVEKGHAIHDAGENVQVTIKRTNGTIQEERTYGDDPRRTKG